jgi:hypothetical protein
MYLFIVSYEIVNQLVRKARGKGCLPIYKDSLSFGTELAIVIRITHERWLTAVGF